MKSNLILLVCSITNDYVDVWVTLLSTKTILYLYQCKLCSYYIWIFLQFREILLEYQASLNEQVRQAKYETARKVQKYYLKCLHQLVNGETNCDKSMYTHLYYLAILVIALCVIGHQMLPGALSISHLILSRGEHLTHVNLQELLLIIHIEDLSVLVILHRTINRYNLLYITSLNGSLFMLYKCVYSKMCICSCKRVSCWGGR